MRKPLGRRDFTNVMNIHKKRISLKRLHVSLKRKHFLRKQELRHQLMIIKKKLSFDESNPQFDRYQLNMFSTSTESSLIRDTMLLTIPEELLLHLLSYLDIQSLLNMKQSSMFLCTLVNGNPTLMSKINFHGVWPTKETLRHFELASTYGNFTATLKLAVGYLYSEGISVCSNGCICCGNGTNAKKAAQLFCKAESLGRNNLPFTWLFYRPPWHATSHCTKKEVFHETISRINTGQTSDPRVLMGISKMLDTLNKSNTGCVHTYKAAHTYVEIAANNGDAYAQYVLWKMKYSISGDATDALRGLQSLIYKAKNKKSIGNGTGEDIMKLQLSRLMCKQRLGAIAESTTFDFIRQSKPSSINAMYKNNPDITSKLRFILVDWLVEVVNLKGFSGYMLHMAINIMDDCLGRMKFSRNKLQLLGISVMVLVARMFHKNIISIQEAVWFVDRTYTYSEIIRMMTEISCILEGNLARMTTYDYVELILEIDEDSQINDVRLLAHYVADMALLHSDLWDFSPARIAATCVFLSRLHLRRATFKTSEISSQIVDEQFSLPKPAVDIQSCSEEVRRRYVHEAWNTTLIKYTGFTIEHLTISALPLHELCLTAEPMTEESNETLLAVRLRHFNNATTWNLLEKKSLDSILAAYFNI